MVAAQLRLKEYYDLHRKPDPNLQSGHMGWLLPRNIKSARPSKKVDYKKIRPFKILAKIGTSAYELGLRLSIAIHNTFHMSLLEPYQDNRFSFQIKEPLLLVRLKEKTNTNSTKSLTLDSTTTGSNTELSGKDIHQNTTKSGTRHQT